MSLQRTIRSQEKRIDLLESQIVRLQQNNERLKEENTLLNNSLSLYKTRADEFEDSRVELLERLNEVSKLKDLLTEAIADAMSVRKNFSKETKTFIKELKKSYINAI